METAFHGGHGGDHGFIALVIVIAGQALLHRFHQLFQAIGRKGGQKTRERYGSEFFSTIGRRGGTALKEEKGVEFFRAIARISRRKAVLNAEA